MLSFVQSLIKKRKCNSFPLSDILDLGCNGKLSDNLDQSKKCYFLGNGVEILAAVVRKT